MVRVSGTPEKHVQAMLNAKASRASSKRLASASARLHSLIKAAPEADLWLSREGGAAACPAQFLGAGCKARRCRLEHDLVSLRECLAGPAPELPQLPALEHCKGGDYGGGEVLLLAVGGELVYDFGSGEIREGAEGGGSGHTSEHKKGKRGKKKDQNKPPPAAAAAPDPPPAPPPPPPPSLETFTRVPAALFPSILSYLPYPSSHLAFGRLCLTSKSNLTLLDELVPLLEKRRGMPASSPPHAGFKSNLSYLRNLCALLEGPPPGPAGAAEPAHHAVARQGESSYLLSLSRSCECKVTPLLPSPAPPPTLLAPSKKGIRPLSLAYDPSSSDLFSLSATYPPPDPSNRRSGASPTCYLAPSSLPSVLCSEPPPAASVLDLDAFLRARLPRWVPGPPLAAPERAADPGPGGGKVESRYAGLLVAREPGRPRLAALGSGWVAVSVTAVYGIREEGEAMWGAARVPAVVLVKWDGGEWTFGAITGWDLLDGMVPEAVEAETKLRMEADPTLNMTKEEAERRPYSLLQAFIFTLTAVTPPFLPPVWDLEATRDTFGGDEDCAFPLLLNRAEGRLAAEVEPGLLQRAHAANFDTWRGNEYRQGLLLPSLVIESDVESRYKVGRTETLYACFKYRVARGELVLSRDHLAGVSGLTGRALLAPLKRGEAVVREGSEGRSFSDDGRTCVEWLQKAGDFTEDFDPGEDEERVACKLYRDGVKVDELEFDLRGGHVIALGNEQASAALYCGGGSSYIKGGLGFRDEAGPAAGGGDDAKKKKKREKKTQPKQPGINRGRSSKGSSSSGR